MRAPLSHAMSAACAVAVLATAHGAQAQSVRVAGGIGPVIPVSGFEEGKNARGLPVDGSHSLRVEWGWPVEGSRPGTYEAGVGLLSIDFPATEELGRPLTVYAFSHMPLGAFAGAELRFDAALGLALGWRAFHPLENRYQLAIGAPVSAFFQAEVSAVRPLLRDLDLTASVGYRHFSNGNLTLPNRGINTMPVSLGLRARPSGFEARRSLLERSSATERASAWAFHLQPFVGVRTFAGDLGHEAGDARYVRQRLPVAGAHLRVDRALNPTLTLTALAGTTWDAGAFRGQEVPALERAPLEASAAFSFGVGASLLVDTGPAWIEAGLGVAALDAGATRQVARLHQRLGVHVRLSDHVRPFVVLRAVHFDRPDFVEWGAAIRVR